MDKKKVLVFPCGSEIGLEIYNSVKDSIHFELYGLSSVNDHGKFVYENYIDGIGFINDIDFINQLNEIIKQYQIDIVYPTMDSVISFLKKNESLIHAKILGSDAETTIICESKQKTYEILQNVINCPFVYHNKSELYNFPLFSKPIIGYGSRNTKIINSKEDLTNFNFDTQLLLEYLPGVEFTIDCFTNLEGKLIFIGARKRNRTSNGISVNTSSNITLTKEFIDCANKINTMIKFKGAWFFQMKKDKDNNYKLLEIACRFAGSSSVHRIKGINFALSNLFLEINKEVEFVLNEMEVEVDRALNSIFKIDIKFDTVYIDLDDTIIVNNKINIDAISFVYRCINKSIKLILITKHCENLNVTLEKFKISSLFDKIIHLKKSDFKYNYISEKESVIFVDDSFSERKQVYNHLNIPVFSTDSLTAL